MLKMFNKILGLSCILIMLLVIGFAYAKSDMYILKNADFVSYRRGWVTETQDSRLVPVVFNETIQIEDHKLTIRRDVDNLISFYSGIAFFTSEQNAKVFVNGEKVYDTVSDRGSGFGVSGGNVWNFVELPNLSRGDRIDIEYINAYSALSLENSRQYQITDKFNGLSKPYVNHDKDYIKLHPIYVGSNYAYANSIITNNILTLAVAYVIVLLGIVTVFFTHHAFYRTKIANVEYLMYFGISVVFSGLYLILSNYIVTSADVDVYLLNELKHICLLFAVLSLGICMTRGDEVKWQKFGRVSMSFAILMLGIRLAAYIYNPLLPFVFTLSTDMYLYIMLLIAGILDLAEALKHKTGAKGWRIFFAVSAIAGVDYILSAYQNIDGIYFRTLALLVYFSSGTVKEMSLYLRLYEGAKEKEQYKLLAGTDQATGLKNRITLKNNLPVYEANREHLAVVLMDINGLKHVNDNQGHAKGDALIKVCADLVVKIFGDIGDCYRIGGDEFLVVMTYVNATEIQNRILRIKRAQEKESEKRSFTVSMAIGLAAYRVNLDSNVEDTFQRADKQMYIDKRAMKEQQQRNKHQEANRWGNADMLRKTELWDSSSN